GASWISREARRRLPPEKAKNDVRNEFAPEIPYAWHAELGIGCLRGRPGSVGAQSGRPYRSRWIKRGIGPEDDGAGNCVLTSGEGCHGRLVAAARGGDHGAGGDSAFTLRPGSAGRSGCDQGARVP